MRKSLVLCIKNLALIGIGQAANGVFKELIRHIPTLINKGVRITIFEKSKIIGAGIPYNPTIAGPTHLLNVPVRSSSLPNNGIDFFQWITTPKNTKIIRDKFYEIHQERLKEKLQKRPEAEDEVRENYQKIWRSIEKFYLDFEDSSKFHPRIVYGIYSAILLEQNLKRLRDSGIEVIEYTDTEVTSLDRDSVIGFKRNNDPKENFLKFDHIMIATDGWPKVKKTESEKHLSKIWPSAKMKNDLDQMIEEEIAKRKAAKNPDRKIEIGIKGSNLSAIDVLREIYSDYGYFEEIGSGREKKVVFTPFKNQEAEIHVTMFSRGGNLPIVQGDLNIPMFLTNYLTLPEREIDHLAASQSGQIYIWQVLIKIAEQINTYYKMLENKEKAKKTADFIDFIKNHLGMDFQSYEELSRKIRDNPHLDKRTEALQISDLLASLNPDYEAILQYFKSMTTYENPIEEMRVGLENEKNTGTRYDNGDFVWKSIARQLLYLIVNLPSRERNFYLSKIDPIITKYSGGIPIQAAEELLALSEAGLFDGVKELGYDNSAGIIEPKAGDEKISFRFSDGKIKECDFIIDAGGLSTNVSQSSSPLIQSMLKNKIITLENDKIRLKGFFAINEEGEITLPNLLFISILGTNIASAVEGGEAAAENFISAISRQPSSSTSATTFESIATENQHIQ